MTPFFKEKWQDSWWIWEFRKQSKVHLSQQRIFIWQDVRFCHSPLWKSSWCLLSIAAVYCRIYLNCRVYTIFHKIHLLLFLLRLSLATKYSQVKFHKLHLVHSWILGLIFSWIFIPMVFLTYIDISKNSRGRVKGDKQKKPLSLDVWQGPEYSPIRPNTQLVAFKLATTSFCADNCNYRAICSNIYVLFTACGIFLLLQHRYVILSVKSALRCCCLLLENQLTHVLLLFFIYSPQNYQKTKDLWCLHDFLQYAKFGIWSCPLIGWPTHAGPEWNTHKPLTSYERLIYVQCSLLYAGVRFCIVGFLWKADMDLSIWRK